MQEGEQAVVQQPEGKPWHASGGPVMQRQGPNRMGVL